MKITKICIENFRGIQRVIATNLKNMVIIAGQNGSGKSCIFDAIRFLKSSYGSYAQNEHSQYFGELTINYQGNSAALDPLFNDKNQLIRIFVEFEFSDEEKTFIRNNAEALLRKTAVQRMFPSAQMMGPNFDTPFSSAFRDRDTELQAAVASNVQEVEMELEKNVTVGSLTISPHGSIEILKSRLLEVAFSHYNPQEIGIIDYHSAQRHFLRENINNHIQLNVEQNAQASQTALYNSQSKYANVKSQMAALYVRELIAQKANSAIDFRGSISHALKELFKAFFPDKEFLGPVAAEDGTLSFPVRTANGSTHDLDDLSSGEKEIVYGYLRMRSSAPKNSIILLDEPELHLNPRLVSSLPAFYNRFLGEELGNQIWLVTHSDALMRSSVGEQKFGLYHMSQTLNPSTQSQLNDLFAEDVDMLISDLVGDLAAFRPGAKAILFEGGGDSEFDRTMSQKLFAEELKGINLISATDKTKVKQLHDILNRADVPPGAYKTKYFAIVDGDLNPEAQSDSLSSFSWSVYHIENFLLEPRYIVEALNSICLDDRYNSFDVEKALKRSAKNILGTVIDTQIKSFINRLIMAGIDYEHAPVNVNVADALFQATARSVDRVNSTFSVKLSIEILREKEIELLGTFDAALEDGTWIKILPGREILKNFVGLHAPGFKYVQFRNLIIACMVRDKFKPPEMLEKFRYIQNVNL